MLFSLVNYPNLPVKRSGEQFIEEFRKDFSENSFDDIYNNYYDNRNPSEIDNDVLLAVQSLIPLKHHNFFSNESLDLVYTLAGLESDIESLNQIKTGSYSVKSFSYDGITYTPEDCDELIPKLEKDKTKVRAELYNNDFNIYNYILKSAENQETGDKIQSLYKVFFHVNQVYEERLALYVEMINNSGFIFQTTPFDLIKEKLKILSETERDFKKSITLLLSDNLFIDQITEEFASVFNDYLEKDRTYFYDQSYKNDELSVMYTCMDNYHTILQKTHFKSKKELLEYQAKLFKSVEKF